MSVKHLSNSDARFCDDVLNVHVDKYSRCRRLGGWIQTKSECTSFLVVATGRGTRTFSIEVDHEAGHPSVEEQCLPCNLMYRLRGVCRSDVSRADRIVKFRSYRRKNEDPTQSIRGWLHSPVAEWTCSCMAPRRWVVSSCRFLINYYYYHHFAQTTSQSLMIFSMRNAHTLINSCKYIIAYKINYLSIEIQLFAHVQHSVHMITFVCTVYKQITQFVH